MNAIEIANQAVEETESLSHVLKDDIRLLVAFGKVALLVERLDGVLAHSRVHRLDEAMREVRFLLQTKAGDEPT